MACILFLLIQDIVVNFKEILIEKCNQLKFPFCIFRITSFYAPAHAETKLNRNPHSALWVFTCSLSAFVIIDCVIHCFCLFCFIMFLIFYSM